MKKVVTCGDKGRASETTLAVSIFSLPVFPQLKLPKCYLYNVIFTIFFLFVFMIEYFSTLFYTNGINKLQNSFDSHT